MANIQSPYCLLSQYTGATLFGENITADLIENHLPFTLDRSGAFNAPGFDATNVQTKLLDAFKNTFYVGDPSDSEKLFYVNMLTVTNTSVEAKKLSNNNNATSPSQVVDEFCNKLADALLDLHSSKGLVHVPSELKLFLSEENQMLTKYLLLQLLLLKQNNLTSVKLWHALLPFIL